MKAWNLFALLLALVILATMVLAVQSPPSWQAEGVGDAEDFATLADGIFSKHVLALEVLGILLTAVMIGAMTIARPLGLPTDREMHYATRIDDELMEELQHVSDVSDDLEYQGAPTPDKAGAEEEE